MGFQPIIDFSLSELKFSNVGFCVGERDLIRRLSLYDFKYLQET